MNFSNEWDRLKADSAGRAPDGRGAGATPSGSDLASVPAEKRKAAEHIERYLLPETRKGGAKADDENEAVTGNHAGKKDLPTPYLPPQGTNSALLTGGTSGLGQMKGWEVKEGLSHAAADWARKLRKLSERLTQDINGLMSTSRAFQSNDHGTAKKFNAVPGQGSRSDTRSGIDKL
ncbi:hypothetical protein [Streptomyces sp. ODS28]|uniref:hypothetical protein n=1 Tax=Streptomyces sp. ODS28 TaxID=3136688 RepID=UPI0031EEDBFB